MNYILCKLTFQGKVHFGNGSLKDTGYTLYADTFFSALCHEALMAGGTSSLTYLVSLVKQRKLVFSDGFPYIHDIFYISRPLIHNLVLSKMDFIPIDQVGNFINSNIDEKEEIEKFKGLGKSSIQVHMGRNGKGGSIPYYVGAYQFHKGNGLYFIIGYKDSLTLEFVKNLLSSLQYTGVGGKKACGYGQFWYEFQEIEETYKDYLCIEEKPPCDWYITLSVSLPLDEEKDKCLKDGVFTSISRGGFIVSEDYTREMYDSPDVMKKKELNVIQSGACVKACYKGQIANVNNGIGHDVYRYALPLFWRLKL